MVVKSFLQQYFVVEKTHNYMKATGSQVVTAREKMGWVQNELAEKLDVSRATIIRQEKAAKLTIPWILKLDKVFGDEGWRKDQLGELRVSSDELLTALATARYTPMAGHRPLDVVIEIDAKLAKIESELKRLTKIIEAQFKEQELAPGVTPFIKVKGSPMRPMTQFPPAPGPSHDAAPSSESHHEEPSQKKGSKSHADEA